MAERFLVTGGTGTTGRRVAALLAGARTEVRIATRNPKSDQDVWFGWGDPASADAFDGCAAAYIVAPTDRTDHLTVMRPILERAIARGTRRFVLLSSSLLEPGDPMMGEVHAWLAAHAPEWAVLRPSWFMQNFSDGPHAGTIREEGTIYSTTGQGRVGFIDADDIAASAVAALTARTPLNADVVLTGPEVLSYDDAASVISEVLGRPVRHAALDRAALTRRFESQGLPPDYADTLSRLDEAIRMGAEDRTTDGVLRLTGQAPASFRSFAEKAGAAWAG